jgi:hypothetical protein
MTRKFAVTVFATSLTLIGCGSTGTTKQDATPAADGHAADVVAQNPDVVPPTPDTAPVTPDTATVTPDTATVTPDTATVTPDTATVTPDTATVTPDTAPPVDGAIPDGRPVVPDTTGDGVGGTDGGADNTGDGGEGTSVDAPSMLVDAVSTLVDAGGGADAAGVDGGAGGAVDSSTCPATGPVCIGNATDDFSSEMLAPYWVPWDICGTTAVSAGALVLDRPATCTGSLGAVLDTCNFEVCGDFDAQVDFALKNFAIPATASRYAGMNVHPLAAATPAWNISVERLNSSYINSNVPQQQNYKGYTTSSVDASSTFVATADTSGRFRITRVGTTLTAYYWNTSAWVPITVTSAPADPMLVIGVYAGGDDPTALTVAFDNFSIASTP